MKNREETKTHYHSIACLRSLLLTEYPFPEREESESFDGYEIHPVGISMVLTNDNANRQVCGGSL